MKRRLLFLVVPVCLLVLCFTGCDMENTGYQVEYYEINASIFSNRPDDATPDEALAYVKGTSASKQYHWSSGVQGLREFFTDTCGYLSGLDEMIADINSKSISAWWTFPGLLSPTNDYFFFYIENNEFDRIR